MGASPEEAVQMLSRTEHLSWSGSVRAELVQAEEKL